MTLTVAKKNEIHGAQHYGKWYRICQNSLQAKSSVQIFAK